MWFKVIETNPERAYNEALEKKVMKRSHSKADKHSYAIKIGKSPRPPKRTHPISWEPEDWDKWEV